MAVFLQFDSLARSEPYIQKSIGATLVWVPNDNYDNPNDVGGYEQPYQTSSTNVQTPTNYRVFHRELNDTNNFRTIGFLAHCRERPTNLTFSVEDCTVIIPSLALVPRTATNGDINYISVLDEPYLYVRIMPINHSEGKLLYSNNPPASEATFMVWLDKTQGGLSETVPVTTLDRTPDPVALADITKTRWLIYKTCMVTVMRLNLDAEEWQIRIFDRFGNDVVIGEDDNAGAGYPVPPPINPSLQTTILIGIKPNYPLNNL